MTKIFLFLIIISFNAMGGESLYLCSKEKGQLEYRLKSCKTKSEKTLADLMRIKKSKRKYTGENITLELKNIKANVAFHMLADFSGYSLLIDANINRAVSLKRIEVPWDQALDNLAQFLKLKAKIINNIIYVEPPFSLKKYKPRKKTYNGSTLTLNFLSIKISDLFKILAEFSGNSFVLGSNINKKINTEISIKRNNIPWDQALDEVAQFLNFQTKVSNGVIYVE
jgi:type II secretory pathway component HofQ